MGRILDPSFELGGTWSLQGAAAYSTDRANFGTRSMRLFAGTAIPETSRATSNLFGVPPGETIPLEYYLNFAEVLQTPDGASELWVGVAAPGKPDVDLQRYSLLSAGADREAWRFKSHAYDVPGDVNQLQLYFRTVPNLIGPGWADHYYLDDVYGGGENVFTKTLRDAVLADLQRIDGTGSFVNDLTAGTIGVEKMMDARKVTPPGAFIIPGTGGNSNLEVMGNTDGRAEQFFQLQLMVRSATPHAAGMNLLDDVRNAIEDKDSNVHAVAQSDWEVDYAGVPNWTEVYTDKQLGIEYGFLDALVRCVYHYRYGLL